MYYYIIFLILLGIAVSGLFIVKQQTSAIVERFGKFLFIRKSGLHIKIPLIDRIAGRISLKILQLDVFDVIRAEVPKMKLDDVFEKKDDVANAVKRELNDAMKNYGYDIIKALVTDIDPDSQVKEAMNRINAAEREKVAAQYEGDAARILIVEKAKAEAESKRLQGQGIADQRREIARGLEESVDVLNNVGINSQEASALIVVTQHYDTLQSIGEETGSNLILLPNSPQAGSDMLNNMVASFTASNQIGEAMKKNNLKTKKNLKSDQQIDDKEKNNSNSEDP